MERDLGPEETERVSERVIKRTISLARPLCRAKAYCVFVFFCTVSAAQTRSDSDNTISLRLTAVAIKRKRQKLLSCPTSRHLSHPPKIRRSFRRDRNVPTRKKRSPSPPARDHLLMKRLCPSL